VLNQTEIKEFYWAVSGVNSTKNKILIEGLKCIEGTCPLDTVEDVPIETGERLWSLPESWDEGEIPKDGQDVVI